jgi:hypothetical protein
MKLVKERKMTVEQALSYAAEREEQEASLSLSNEAQVGRGEEGGVSKLHVY